MANVEITDSGVQGSEIQNRTDGKSSASCAECVRELPKIEVVDEHERENS